jgi:hypothetical protein
VYAGWQREGPAAGKSKRRWNGLQEKSKNILLCEGGSGLSYTSVDCMPDKGGDLLGQKFHDQGKKPAVQEEG